MMTGSTANKLSLSKSKTTHNTKMSNKNRKGDNSNINATTNTAAKKKNEDTTTTSTTNNTNNNTNNQIMMASFTSLGRAETKWIACLRVAVLSVLLVAAILLSTGIYLYTRDEERTKFTNHFDDNSHQVIESFHGMIERNIGAAASLSTAVTSYAISTNQSFPFVTLPDFALRGSHARIQSGSLVIHWLPLVTDSNRIEWEQYAYENRQHIDVAFQNDQFHRTKQDDEIQQQQQQHPAYIRRRDLQQQQQQQQQQRNMTILEDGTGYHPKIWNNGALTIRGDEPEGSGPYLPAWQRSPVSAGKQDVLNLNFAETKVIGHGLLDNMMREKKAVLRNAAIPIPKFKKRLEANLRISQFRENIEDFVDGLSTFLAYPVFKSLHDEQQQQQDDDDTVVGILATNVLWKVLFSNLLPSSSQGIICVVENSFDQTFTYAIDGPEATFLGMGDHHDHRYDGMEVKMSINDYLKDQFSAQNRAYSTVPLSDEVQYWLRVYPSQSTQDQFVTRKPAIYTAVVICFFVFAALLFLLFSYVVERRQHIMLQKVVENANRVATAERELNEFLSHEVRNPLSAAISACSFVSEALNQDNPLQDEESKKCVREDIEVVNSSLHFINQFLRSMLDIHKVSDNQIKITKTPCDVLQDIFEPLSAILYTRVADFEVILDCPQGLIIQTDSIRLKQVVLNLARNSSKFVEQGFIRLCAKVVDQDVVIFVEDSGPGVPEEKRNDLFSKYQPSLDQLGQGTGLGLSLSKKLMNSMGGDIYLDETYQSGIEGCRGSRFVVQLNTSPVDIESTLPTDSETEHQTCTLRGQDYVLVTGPASQDALNTSHLPDKSSPVGKPREVTVQGMKPTEEASPEALPELPEHLSVLFVDDDAVIRKLFVRGLSKARPNWTIAEAASGEKALQLCEGQKFDLIFLDQYMASVEKQLLGTETAQAMRIKGVDSVICGLSANNIRDAFVNAGANDFILKPMPCKPDDLKQVLQRLLEKRMMAND